MRRIWAAVFVLASCKYEPPDATTPGDDDPVDDGPPSDGPSDGTPADTPVDLPVLPPDARDCSGIAAPSGCTAVPFGCPGSASCFVLCTNLRNYSNARGSCAPGTLAVPSTQEEADCTREFVVARNIAIGGSQQNVWIGLEQLMSPALPTDNWFWVDGTAVTLDGWGNNPDQPDDGNGSENGSENCGNLEPAVGFAWNDDGCGDSRNYMCELP